MKKLLYFLKPGCSFEFFWLVVLIIVMALLFIDYQAGPPNDPLGIAILLLVLVIYGLWFYLNYDKGNKSLINGLTKKQYLCNIATVKCDMRQECLKTKSITELEDILNNKHIRY